MRIVTSILLLAFLFMDATGAGRVDRPSKKGYKIRTVVLDAGHGGHDSGCHGKSALEKNVALAIVLKLGHYIEQYIPEVKVIYTRKTDKFVELRERAAIANRAHADLFISVHCNAAASPNAHGTESWVMGLHKSEANLEVAKRENAVILMENDYQENYQYDPNSPVAHIMFSLYQNAFLTQSTRLAQLIEDQFSQRVGRNTRGVKQAGFLVLYRTSMPSVLIESGFLSNPKEEKFLSSDYGQDLIASAIFRAFRDYKKEMESSEGTGPVEDSSKTEENTQPVKDTTSIAAVDTAGSQPQGTAVEFRVQILATYKKIDTGKTPYNRLSGLYAESYENGLLRYYYGHFHTREEAEKDLAKVRQSGFPDAFLVGFVNGQRTTYREALEQLE